MKNKNRSLVLSHILVKAFYAVLALVAVACVCVLVAGKDFLALLTFHAVSLLVVVPFGLGALICLDKLLNNLKNKIVFDNVNVIILRNLSWIFFGVSLVTLLEIVVLFLIGGTIDLFSAIFLYPLYPIMCIGEFFIGLIVRVVKNSFESAIKLKEENDLTI